MSSGNVHAVAQNKDMTAADEYVLREWELSLLSAGWSPASARRARNRLAELARATRAGLLHATRDDVVALGERRGKAAGVDVESLIRSEGWRASVRTIRAFYRWLGQQKFLGAASDPTVRIRQLPAHTPGVRVRPRDGILYEKMLHAPGLSLRDQSILTLLAVGLTPREVASLRLEHLGLPLTTLRSGYGLRRVVSLSEQAVIRLHRWLSVRPKHVGPYLFPSSTPGRPISASGVRAIVRRAAAVTFPRPAQDELRRRIYALGFRHLFVQRALAARVPPACLRDLTGVDRLSRLAPYLSTIRRLPQVSNELTRMSRRWAGWI